MKNVIATTLLLLFWTLPASGDQDVEGARDHRMFTRMPGFFIENYVAHDFDRMAFATGEETEIQVEGHYTSIAYAVKEGAKVPSELQILRNYENAARSIGGEVVFGNQDIRCIRIPHEGRKIYLKVSVYNGGELYLLEIVETQAMIQDVKVDADSLFSSLQAKGSAAVGGIYFDFNQSRVKPESGPALAEVARLLQDKPDLKLYVVGHTDNVGGLEGNLKLSQARARAVVAELVKQHGIAPGRLDAHGLACLAPVASNRTPEGQALNRRVELVEQ